MTELEEKGTTMSIDTTELVFSTDGKEIQERLHALEVAQATGAATLAGAQATQAAVQAGTTATNSAMQVGTIGMMATGSVSLIVGIFLGIVIRGLR